MARSVLPRGRSLWPAFRVAAAKGLAGGGLQYGIGDPMYEASQAAEGGMT